MLASQSKLRLTLAHGRPTLSDHTDVSSIPTNSCRVRPCARSIIEVAFTDSDFSKVCFMWLLVCLIKSAALQFLPRNLQPQVGAIPTAVRRAALLQRVRAKEAALRGTALSVAVCEAESAVEATSSLCLSVHGERPHNEWQSGAGVGLLGTAGKLRECASC